jgi:hypothetical protein
MLGISYLSDAFHAINVAFHSLVVERTGFNQLQ